MTYKPQFFKKINQQYQQFIDKSKLESNWHIEQAVRNVYLLDYVDLDSCEEYPQQGRQISFLHMNYPNKNPNNVIERIVTIFIKCINMQCSGIGIIYYTNGWQYCGYIINNQMSGYGMQFDNSMRLYWKGRYLGDQPHGYMEWYENGYVFIEYWIYGECYYCQRKL